MVSWLNGRVVGWEAWGFAGLSSRAGNPPPCKTQPPLATLNSKAVVPSFLPSSPGPERTHPFEERGDDAPPVCVHVRQHRDAARPQHGVALRRGGRVGSLEHGLGGAGWFFWGGAGVKRGCQHHPGRSVFRAWEGDGNGQTRAGDAPSALNAPPQNKPLATPPSPAPPLPPRLALQARRGARVDDPPQRGRHQHVAGHGQEVRVAGQGGAALKVPQAAAPLDLGRGRVRGRFRRGLGVLWEPRGVVGRGVPLFFGGWVEGWGSFCFCGPSPGLPEPPTPPPNPHPPHL